MRFPRRKGPAGPVLAVRRTGQPDPRFNYELFNCNNFNIRYWSWNYAAAGTRLALQLFLVKGFRLYSFQLRDPKEPRISIYCHYLPVSGLGNLRACCLLGCGSRFSGSLSGIEP
ncbi:hypothetical protein P170DRAFT_491262 [Aspergillus steynii IBT 23096]|uniref:Uncharacterized protein n=2 Tax=Aspergillaceae TaxID=1131492 RepID=A0A2I2FQ88_9EURO|nr:hypothetical protein P170DRAFT_491262 [Aspergillus steynii IBT 23096]